MFLRSSTKRFGIMLLLSVWGGVIVSFAVYDKHRKDNKASLELESEVVAFGNIGAGLEAEKVTHLTNRGAKEVIISEIKTGCGCTGVSLDRNHIKPGETVRLRITMRSDGMRDQSVMIYLFTNDNKSPVKALRATANREASVFVEPKVIDFGIVDRGRILGASRSVMLFGKDEEYRVADMVTSLQAVAGEPFIRVDMSSPCTEDGKPITVTLAKDAPTGDINSYVLLNDSRRNLTMKVTVIGRVRGGFFALPQMALFLAVTRNDGVVRQDIVIKQRVVGRVGKERWQIGLLKICDTLKRFVTAKQILAPIDNAASFSLLVDADKCDGAWSPRMLEGNVRAVCRCDDGYEEEIIVPIRISFKGSRIPDK